MEKPGIFSNQNGESMLAGMVEPFWDEKMLGFFVEFHFYCIIWGRILVEMCELFCEEKIAVLSFESRPSISEEVPLQCIIRNYPGICIRARISD